jgi:ribonuclease HI
LDVSAAPVLEIVGNKDASSRIAKWAIELAPYVPHYERRDAFDGSKVKEGLGAGIVLTSPKGDQLKYVLQIHFKASNNVAEYAELVHGLKAAKEIGVRRIIYYDHSDLVVQQCSSEWDAKDANIASYRFHVQQVAGFFEGCEFHHVPREDNEAPDALSKLGSSRQAIPVGIALEHLRKHRSSQARNPSQSSF